MITEWQTFASGHPQLGQVIKVRCEAPGSKVIDLGTVKVLEDIGGTWISITTDNYANAAVRKNYQWCAVKI